MKICSKCLVSKFVNEFHKQSKSRDGLRHWCKSCVLLDNANREHRYKGTRVKYRADNADIIRENKKIYYQTNREIILKSNSNYRTSLNYKFAVYRSSARTRNITWALTKEEFEKLWNLPCYYCNSPIPTIGIDRVKSKLDYSVNNIVPCCSLCNTIKMDLSYSEFTEQIKKIYDNLKLWEPIKK